MYGHLLLVTALATLVSPIPIEDASPGEHIQHVTIPPISPTAASNSSIQRVPSKKTSLPEITTKTQPIQPSVESSSEASALHAEEPTIPQAFRSNEVNSPTETSESATMLPPWRDDTRAPMDNTRASVDVTRAPMDVTRAPMDETRASGDDTRAPVDYTRALVDDTRAPVDDLMTASFGWGLGPVYPHLYQFKRVPHLVPIHSWNPYHDYYTYHKRYPNYIQQF